MEWQPIDTAPNGIRILAWIPWWDGAAAYSGIFSDGDFFPDYRNASSSRPTHWMPLPEAPNAEITGRTLAQNEADGA